MTGPALFPLPPGSRIIGTRLLRHSIRVAGPGTSIQVSPELPFPSILGWMEMGAASTFTQNNTFGTSIFLARDADPTDSPTTLGTNLTMVSRRGTSPPDSNTEGGFFGTGSSGQFMFSLPLYLIIPGPEHFLKTRTRNDIAGATEGTFLFVFFLLDKLPPPPEEAIIPRGTEVEPVCVRVCEPVQVTGLPAPTPTPPTPPLPTLIPAPHLDLLAEPLPDPCDIDPDVPLSAEEILCT